MGGFHGTGIKTGKPEKQDALLQLRQLQGDMECIQEAEERRKKKPFYAPYLGRYNEFGRYGNQWGGGPVCPAHPTLLGTGNSGRVHGVPIFYARFWWHCGDWSSQAVYDRDQRYKSWYGVPVRFIGFLRLF